MERHLALELAGTVRHDGQGGVTDDLITPAGLTHWIRGQSPLLDAAVPGGITADERLRAEVVALRQAVRTLFARAVRPGPPSPADAHRLLPDEQALARLNAAAAREPVAPRLEWSEAAAPVTAVRSDEQDPGVRLLAALARAAIDFLAGPEREKLRACTAPRCVRYFVKEHGRQEWCKPSCGNRARAARHYRRVRDAAAR
ncbi:CGNR zinc finger domain-containing protein [Streptomyces avicenniae]|uniref:CGNR zinc finger domain-containing protein n=1 Tax=Streptomyces avicenniae TaxID=500153 RepID=UPI00069A6D45|nr:ABATE domain-containing protein [Streptomyces avicenniae]